MLIDPKAPICGVRPGRLKQLLREDMIRASSAVGVLGVSVDTAEQKLAELADAGWLVRDDRSGAWAPSDQGRRLAATPLVKRFSAEEGRKIVRCLVDRATEINADPSYYFVVRRLVLFGSVLTAKPEAAVGDVDVAVVKGRRLPKGAAHDALWEQELAGAPSGYGGTREVYWPHVRIQRALKQRQQRVSLHELTDAEAAARRAVIYRFDPKSGAERISLPW